jgi:hypothetical protein
LRNMCAKCAIATNDENASAQLPAEASEQFSAIAALPSLFAGACWKT